MNRGLLVFFLGLGATLASGLTTYFLLRACNALNLLNDQVFMRIDSMIAMLALSGLLGGIFLQLFLLVARKAQRDSLRELEQRIAQLERRDRSVPNIPPQA